MITVGSISREEAAAKFFFLQENVRGRWRAINELTHKDPDFVFWISPGWQALRRQERAHPELSERLRLDPGRRTG